MGKIKAIWEQKLTEVELDYMADHIPEPLMKYRIRQLISDPYEAESMIEVLQGLKYVKEHPQS